MATIGDLIINLQVRGGREAISQFNALKSAMSPLNNAFKNITRGLISGITEGLRFNMMMEDMNMSFRTLTGSAAKGKGLSNNILKLAADTPLATEALAKAAKTMLGYGIVAEDIIPNLKMLGDLSLGNSDTLQRLATAFSQTTSATKLTGEEMRQYRNAGLNPLKLMSEQTGVSMAELDQKMRDGEISAEMVKKAFIGATTGTGRFSGAMVNASKTLSGQMEKLRDYGSIFLGEFTQPIVNGLKQIIPTFVEFIQRLTNGSSIINDVINTMDSIFTKIGKVVKDVFSGMDKDMMDIIITVGLVIAGIAPLGVAFGAIVAVIGFAVSGITALIGVFTSISPVVFAVIGAITALAAIFTDMILNNDNLKRAIMNAFNEIKNAVMVAVNFIVSNMDNIKAVFERVRNAVMSVVPIIVDTITRFGQSIKPVVEDVQRVWSNLVKLFQENQTIFTAVFAVIGAAVAWFVGTFVGAFNGLVRAIGPIVSVILGLIDTIINVFRLVGAIISGEWGKIPQILMDIGTSILDVIVSAFSAVVEFIVGFVDGIIAMFTMLYNVIVGGSIIPDMVNAIIMWFNTLISTVINIVQTLVNTAINIFNALKAAITSIISAIKTVITNGFNAAKSIVTSIISSIKSVISSGFNAARSIVSSVISSIRSVISSGFNAARSIVSSVISSIRSVVSSGFNSVRSIISSAVNSARSRLSSAFNSMRSIASSAINSIRSIVNRLGGIFRSALSSAMGAIRSVAGSMYSAGANLVQNLINGVTAKIGQFRAKISELANAAKQFLGFSSPTEKGAGRTAHKWIPNLIDMMGKQLEQGVGRISLASGKVASAIQQSTTATIGNSLQANRTVITQGSPTNVMIKIDASHMDVDQLGTALVSKLRSYGIRSQTQ